MQKKLCMYYAIKIKITAEFQTEQNRLFLFENSVRYGLVQTAVSNDFSATFFGKVLKEAIINMYK
jgi:hypothetical protein